MRTILAALVLLLTAPTTPARAVEHPGVSSGSATTTVPAAPRSPGLPALRVRRLVTDLDNPWDVQRLPGGTLLVSERDRARLSAYSDGIRRTVDFPADSIWVSGETGLMSLEVDPDFADNHRFYTCSGWNRSDGSHDVRVVAWELDAGITTATRVETLVSGFPTTSGRHGGCRLLITANGALLVGTGDAAVGTNPRDLTSLGGKTLRLDPDTGRPWPANPYAKADNKRQRYVFTYGHRNVQGLAQRQDGTLWSVEHGSFRDDEVNRLRPGGDYGWHPVPGYDESVPMTDHSLPGKQVSARWSSGEPTLATSGATWVYGKEWGRLDGTLAVAALKASRVVFMKFDARGRLEWTRSPQELRQLGRLRSVTLTPNRSLLLTTDNDGDGDAILRVTPR